MSPTPTNPTPGQPGGDNRDLDAIKKIIANSERPNSEQVGKVIKDVAGEVKKAMTDMANTIKESDIANNLLALHNALEEGSNATAKEIQFLRDIAVQHEQLAAAKWKATMAKYSSTLGKRFGEGSGTSFLSQESPTVDNLRLAKGLARNKRAGDIVQSGGFEELVGSPITKDIGSQMMARGMEGELFKASDAMIKLNAETKKGSVEREAGLKNYRNEFAAVINQAKELNKNQLQGSAIADRESSRIKKTARAGTSSLRDVLPEGLARMMDSSPLFGKLRDKEEAAASGGKAMGIGSQIASMGLEKMAGAIGQLAGLAGSVSIVFAALSRLIGMMDEARKVQGAAIPALAAGAGKMGIGYEQFALDVMTSNRDIEVSLGQTNDFMPLVTEAFSAMGKVGAGAGEGGASSMKALARSLLQVGVAGKSVGMEFGQSMAIALGFQKSLGLAGGDVSNYFKHYITMSKIASMSMDEFTQSIGNAMDYTKQFGESATKGIIDEMAMRVDGMSRAATSLTHGAFKDLLGMNLTRQAGLAMAAGGGVSGLARLQKSGGGSGETPLGVLSESAGKMMDKVAQGLQGKGEATIRLGMASAAGDLISPAIAKALFYEQGDLSKSALYKAVTGKSGKTAEEQKELIRKAELQYDPQVAGADAMTKASGTLERIEAILQNLVKAGVRSGMSWFFGNSADEILRDPKAKAEAIGKLKGPNLGASF